MLLLTAKYGTQKSTWAAVFPILLRAQRHVGPLLSCLCGATPACTRATCAAAGRAVRQSTHRLQGWNSLHRIVASALGPHRSVSSPSGHRREATWAAWGPWGPYARAVGTVGTVRAGRGTRGDRTRGPWVSWGDPHGATNGRGSRFAVIREPWGARRRPGRPPGGVGRPAEGPQKGGERFCTATSDSFRSPRADGKGGRGALARLPPGAPAVGGGP